ncbi:MAG: DUF1127 domain-containing protein [Arenicellales bacterium]
MTSRNTCINESSLGDRISCTLNLFNEWHTRRQERRELLKVSDAVLRDIGISRADADREYRKPFWQL